MLPGRQGLSLTVDQFTALVLAIPDIKKALSSQGFDIDENFSEEEEPEADEPEADEPEEEDNETENDG
jgi:hypothetical protein